MISKELQDFAEDLVAAMEWAQSVTDRLSLSVPSPIKDRFMFNLLTAWERERGIGLPLETMLHLASGMAQSALGWGDMNAPRPSPEERMDQLQANFTSALSFLLDSLRRETGGA